MRHKHTRRFILCHFFLAFGLAGLMAQNAPDFQITDSNGNPHSLYADYLNQGKTVLIKVFFTTCPPCNAIAPYMEPLYQEWGAGEYDVEFFELSDKNFDTDVLVNTYKTNYGQTFPGAGVEGGSLEAVQPYKSGMFGQFWGTPTFIVIAPDGSVNFDVNGPNNQGTIDAIDVALAATGAMKPMIEVPDTAIINGRIELYYNTTGIANALVYLVDVNDPLDILASDSSDINGEFSLVFDSSGIDPDQYAIRVLKQHDPKNGVSGVDLIAIQKHILGIDPLDDPQLLLAMESNQSGSITLIDIVLLLKIIQGITLNFPDDKSWLFYSASGNLSSPEAFPAISQISLNEAFNDPDDYVVFKGIKKGDLNRSVDPQE